jgi:hypothetical protein
VLFIQRQLVARRLTIQERPTTTSNRRLKIADHRIIPSRKLAAIRACTIAIFKISQT